MSFKEAALALLAMLIVGLFAYLPHIKHGGFYLDDWSDVAGTFYPPGGRSLHHTLDYFASLFPYRPGLIIYVPLKYFVLGADPAAQLSLAVLLAMAVAFLLYGILRFFNVPWYHAGAIALLTIVFPSFDSTRLWEAASLPSVALIFALGGMWLALVALDRRSWPLHLCAAALYLVSILTYEITLPVIAAAGFLYVMSAGWKVARSRWAVDLVVVVAGGLWNGLHTNREVSGVGHDLEHLWKIVKESRIVITTAVDPLGSNPPTLIALLALVVVFAVGAIVWARSRSELPATEGPDRNWDLGRWLLLGGAGLAVAALGWAMFVPANVYYTPSLLGLTNRVNAVSGLGLVILAYAAIGVAIAVIGSRSRLIQRWTPVIVLVLAAVLGATYIHTLRRHAQIWDAAYREERTLIDRVKQAYPSLPPESVLFTTGYPANYTLGVPIFTATWDISGMLKDEYKDGSLNGYPVFDGNQLVCRKDGVAMTGVEGDPYVTPYGSARLFNVTTGKRATPANRADCERQLDDFPPGPAYIMYQY
jgi:hypothetical protein